MPWKVEISAEAFGGVAARFREPPPSEVLEFVRQYLEQHAETYFGERWEQRPDRFFVFVHYFAADERSHFLEFVIDEAQRSSGLLRIVWVEHYPGISLE